MKEYSQDVLTWITDMNFSSVVNSDQKMSLVETDFFAEFSAKGNPNRVKLKEKLNSSEKKQFTELVTDNNNFTLLNVMSNICYKKINKDQKGLGVFMDVLFKSCEK